MTYTLFHWTFITIICRIILFTKKETKRNQMPLLKEPTQQWQNHSLIPGIWDYILHCRGEEGEEEFNNDPFEVEVIGLEVRENRAGERFWSHWNNESAMTMGREDGLNAFCPSSFLSLLSFFFFF